MKTTTSGASGPIMDTTNEPGAGEHQGLPLNASVRDALLAYLANMDGHEI